ncbi:unnamed protein product, partial [Brachionus calyciflorus]
MFKKFVSIILLININYIVCLTDEELITKQILNGYVKQQTPSESLNLTMDLNLRQILNVDVPLQTITTSSLITLTWFDTRLKWNSTDFNNINSVILKAGQIWLPEINVINSADSDGHLKIADTENMIVFSSGKIQIFLNTILKTRCVMNVLKFPYDEHTCDIRISTWDLSSQILNQDLKLSSDFFLNPVWNVKKLTGKTLDKSNASINLDNISKENIIFTLIVKRLALHYVMNGIFPNILLNFLLLLVFFLNYKSQVGTTLGLILTTSVYLLKFGGEVPAQSDHSPYLVIYFVFCNVYNVVCLTWFIFVARLMEKNYLPKWVVKMCMRLRCVKDDNYEQSEPKVYIQK